ncbi:MAG: sigma 54-interacting transcriptional regulator [Candidatus Goldbacteria bacterium]|nr:sigma 54-interacting transcriptional regulator [Candidatus Goldiibacteriota bacterium]
MINSYEKIAKDFQAIIENTYDGLYITDGEANTLMVNQAYERITGIKREEVIGKNMRELVAKGVFDRSVSLEVIEKKRPVTIMQELRSGKKVLVTGSPVFNEKNDEIILVVTNVRDITELMELKDELHERTLEINRYIAELNKIKTLKIQEDKFATKSKIMLEVLERAIKAAQFDSNILITGESGVGKGLMARLIHDSSSRKNGPFIVINCASIPEDLFESELFGYEPGAFSGASSKGKKGLLEVADKGTLFLDEIGDMSLRLQSKLLRVIEEKELVRLGSTKVINLDVRIIAATNQDLDILINQKKFRQDLYFRLNTISIYIPPLRERKEDIMPLIQYFIDKLNKKYHMKKRFSSNTIHALMTYSFPGNVRELSNIVEQAFQISNKNIIEIEDLPYQIRSIIKSQSFDIEHQNKSYNEIINLMEYKILKNAIAKYGSTHKAAKYLKISQSTVVRKLKKLQDILKDSQLH